MKFAASTLAVAIATMSVSANAQDGADRPWLEGLPITQQSLELPAPRVPDLDRPCEVPDSFAAYRAASTAGDGPYSDDRLHDWIELYHACDWQALERTVADDLRGGDTHVDAPLLWALARDHQGGLQAGWSAALDQPLRAALGEVPELYRLYSTRSNRAGHAYVHSLGRVEGDGAQWTRILAGWLEDAGPKSGKAPSHADALEANPDLFFNWWPSNWSAREDREAFDRLTGPGGPLADHFFAATAREYVLRAKLESANRVVLANMWLERHPGDPYALRYRDIALGSLGHSSLEAETALEAAVRFPLLQSSHDAAPLYENGNAEAGDFVVAATAWPNSEAATVAASYAREIAAAGYSHDAHAIMGRVAPGAPADIRVSDRQFYLEQAAGRHARALEHAKASWAMPGAGWNNARNLVNAYRQAGFPDRALEAYDQGVARLGSPTAAMVVAAADAAKAAGDDEREEALLATALDLPLDRPVVLRRLIGFYKDRDQSARVVRHSRDLLQSVVGWESDHTTFYAAADALNGAAGIREAMDWALDNSLNRQAAEYRGIDALKSAGETEAATRLAREAEERYPARYWPVYLQGQTTDSGPAFREWVSRVKGILPRLDAYSRAWAVDNLVFFGIEAIGKSAFTREELAGIAPLFEKERDGMTLARATRRGFKLYDTLGQADKATAVFERSLAGRLHESDPLNFLRSNTSGYDSALVFKTIWSSLSRDRFDSDRLKYWMQAHSRWGGAPALSYCLAEWVDTNFPEGAAGVALERVRATGSLGNAAESFRRDYSRSTTVGASQRYIGFYNKERESALDGSAFVDVDCNTGVVSTIGQDGEIAVRQQDFRTGKLRLLADGGAWIAYDYTDSGQVTSLRSSNGQAITMEYNDAGKITVMRDSRLGPLTFDYNEAGKPVRIAESEGNFITVDYDAAGEISRVEGFSETEEVSNGIALRITQRFQSLLTLARPEQAKRLLARTSDAFDAVVAKIVDVPSSDPAFTAATTELMQAAIANRDTGSGPMRQVDSVLSRAVDTSLASANAADVARFGEALYRLYSDISPRGLPDARKKIWTEFLEVAETHGDNRAVASLLADIRSDPLEPMPQQGWGDLAELRNPGYWYSEAPSVMQSAALRSGLSLSALTFRDNGDLVVAGNTGLMVRRAGAWQRYRFEVDENSFLRDDTSANAGDALEITSLVELPAGRFAIGTNRGVFVVEEDYTSNVARLATQADGMPSALVRDMHLANGQLHVATSGGLASFAVNAGGLSSLGSTAITGDVAFVSAGRGSNVIAGDGTGIYEVSGDSATKLTDLVADDAVYSRRDQQVIALRNSQLYSLRESGSGWASVVPLTNARSANIDREAFGFGRLDVGGEEHILLLGDRGYSLWRDGYFEYLTVPGSSELPPILAMGAAHGQLALAAGNGSVYRFDPTDFMVDRGRAVLDSEYDAVNDVAYFADGSQIRSAVSREAGTAPRVVSFDAVRATLLDLDAQQRLVANDGMTVLRYDAGAQPEVLFEARPFCPEDGSCNNAMTGLLAASDGSVWATVGPAAFRWHDGEVTEYNFYRDRDIFPAQTNWLAGVVELPSGDVVVSSSSEGHLTYRGQKLSGTNLVFRGDRFDPFDDSALFLSATETDGIGIIGSTGGFYEADGDRLTPMRSAGNATYDALLDAHPNIYLANEGAELGGETLLFPTAAGIVANQGDTWFYPERINWLFPDAERADLGGRHSNSVEVDKAGRIYVGTDRGLVIFQQSGGDAIDFLLDNDRADLAFASMERRKLRREADALLSGIDRSDPKFAKLNQVIKAREELASVRAGKGQVAVQARRRSASANAGEGAERGSGNSLSDAIEAREREYTRLLAVLEREDPGLAQLLNIQPLELSALRRQVPEGTVVVQYIPRDDELMLNVISRDKHVVRTVEVSRETLMDAAINANLFLDEQVGQIEQVLGGGASIFAASDAADLPLDTPQGELAALYDILFAPIEADLEGFERIYVSPAGGLNYVPFSALTRTRGNESTFAVERYNLAVVPTSYLLQLVLNDQSRSSDAALIFGDPDLTLANGRAEAREVGDRVASLGSEVVLRTGNAASIDVLEQYGNRARLLHFATHGRLDASAPERSYLVMADDRRLSTIDIMTLNLTDAELAFLSACETARGADGLEYATLARSFSHAGVPTTIASLWPVGDAATLELVKRFYDGYDGDSMAALAEAQRAMIEQGGALGHPASWASFEVFGRGY